MHHIMSTRRKRIRIGILGARRGASFVYAAMRIEGVEVVALCDKWESFLREKLAEINPKRHEGHPEIIGYTDFDKFIKHDLDAVVLCNYFHEHAPFAIKALNTGLHVMSECSACHTLAEGVQLAEAVEKSGKVYMLAENFAYGAAILAMRTYYQTGEIGKLEYAEAISAAEKIWEEKRKCFRGEAWNQLGLDEEVVAEHKAGDIIP